MKYSIIGILIYAFTASHLQGQSKSKSADNNNAAPNTQIEKSSDKSISFDSDPITSPLCQYEGILRFTNDNTVCSMVIESLDGKKYIPIEFPDQTALESIKGNMGIKFSFEKINGIKLNCPISDQYIKLLCIENISKPIDLAKDISRLENCEDVLDPFSVPWMNQCIIKIKPREIKKYNRNDEWAYAFINERYAYYYTCHGDLICTIGSDQTCETAIKELSDPITILVVND